MEIFNPIGEKVFSRKIISSEEKISCKNFSAGIFLLTITSDTSSLTKKFIVER
jgi:hypothetical protein